MATQQPTEQIILSDEEQPIGGPEPPSREKQQTEQEQLQPGNQVPEQQSMVEEQTEARTETRIEEEPDQQPNPVDQYMMDILE